MASARALVFVALLSAGALAGCFDDGEGPRLAQPTDAPSAAFPTRSAAPTRSTPQPTFNTTDPGLVLDGEWNVDDAWYWETTNTSPARFRSTHVVEKGSDRGRTIYVLEETYGFLLNPPQARSRVVVDASIWSRVGATDERGTRITWTPPAPDLRYYHNGTFAYNESGVSPEGIRWDDSHAVRAFYAGPQQVARTWGGIADAHRIEHRDLVTERSGKEKYDLIVHWVDPTLLNDVLFAYDSDGDRRLTDADPHYALIGARVNGKEYGRLTLP